MIELTDVYIFYMFVELFVQASGPDPDPYGLICIEIAPTDLNIDPGSGYRTVKMPSKRKKMRFQVVKSICHLAGGIMVFTFARKSLNKVFFAICDQTFSGFS